MKSNGSLLRLQENQVYGNPLTSETSPSAHDGCTTRGSFPATTGLGFTGFFFPLLQPVLVMGDYPTIRQQGF
jgi:hypothetical protein